MASIPHIACREPDHELAVPQLQTHAYNIALYHAYIKNLHRQHAINYSGPFP
jgi:hypothetical protein